MEEKEDKNTSLSKEVTHKKGFMIIRKILFSLLIIFVLFIVFYLFIARPRKMAGDSMSPYFKNNEYVWVEKISYYLHTPKRGDVVFFVSQSNPNETVSRIIGLPNETVSLKPGEIKINGSVLDTPHVNWGKLPSLSNDWLSAEITLKDNEYFGMSDNLSFLATDSANITTNKDAIQIALQKFLENSVFTKQDITGKASNITYY